MSITTVKILLVLRVLIVSFAGLLICLPSKKLVFSLFVGRRSLKIDLTTILTAKKKKILTRMMIIRSFLQLIRTSCVPIMRAVN